MKRQATWIVLLAANALCYCVLSFCQTTDAAPPSGGGPPFANAVQQRIEMIELLKDIRAQLRQQNALLKSGDLKVVVSEPKKP